MGSGKKYSCSVIADISGNYLFETREDLRLAKPRIEQALYDVMDEADIGNQGFINLDGIEQFTNSKKEGSDMENGKKYSCNVSFIVTGGMLFDTAEDLLLAKERLEQALLGVMDATEVTGLSFIDMFEVAGTTAVLNPGDESGQR